MMKTELYGKQTKECLLVEKVGSLEVHKLEKPLIKKKNWERDV